MIARQLEEKHVLPIRRQPVAWRGPALAKEGRWREALRVAKTRLNLQPEHLGALEVIAQSLLALGRTEECLGTVRTLVRLNPHEPAYEVWRSAALQTQGRHLEALNSLRRAHSMYRESRIKEKVMAEMELLVRTLELGGRESTQVWIELGMAPPQPRRRSRESQPVVN